MTAEFSVKRITDALAAVDRARNEMDSAKATYKAKRELLQEAQTALEDAIRAETSPAPLFDHVEITVTNKPEPEPGQADEDDENEPTEEVFPTPVTWNVYDAYRRKDAGTVDARSWSEAQRLAHGHYPEIPEGACLVTRVKDKQWTGAASDPDAWRHQGVGLALRTLTVPTVKKLGQVGLATVGQLKDWFLANPGKSIEGLGTKGTLAVEEALVKYLDARPVTSQEAHPDGDEDAE